MNQSIYQLIKRHAIKCPSKTAVISDGNSLTYEQLINESNNLANYLKTLGVKKNDVVAIYLNRSCNLIVSVLAALELGATFLPLDTSQTNNWNLDILQISTAKFLIADSSLKPLDLKSNAPLLIYIDHVLLNNSKSIRKNKIRHKNTDHIVYIIFTSGSTGKPKGIKVSHNNLIHTYTGWEEIYQLNSFIPCVLQMAKFSFDVFIGDFVRALCAGGKLVLCPHAALFHPQSLYQVIIQEQINCAEFVPAILRFFVDYLHRANIILDGMRLLIVGSDTWTINDYKRLKTVCSKNTRIINSYGLSETTIDSTYFDTTELDHLNLNENEQVPIGIPFPHVYTYILDANLQPVPAGEIGELYIGGKGITVGYVKNPQLTKSKYILDPFRPLDKKKLYKSGDVAKYLSNNNLQLLGRLDNQVKIRGIRIEVEAIEGIINVYHAISSSIVKAHTNQCGDIELAAFVVIKENHPLNLSDLLNYLATHLPSYMIPTNFYHINNQPLTLNGKIDRNTILYGKQLSVKSSTWPSNQIEKCLLEIFQENLKIQQLDTQLHFSMLGIDSLSIAKLLDVINTKLSCELNIHDTMQHNCIFKLARYIEELRTMNAGISGVSD